VRLARLAVIRISQQVWNVWRLGYKYVGHSVIVVIALLLFVKPIHSCEKAVKDSLEQEIQVLSGRIADLRAYLLVPDPEREAEALLRLGHNFYKRDYMLWQLSMCPDKGGNVSAEPPPLDLSAAVNAYDVLLINQPDVPECADALFNMGLCIMAMAKVNNRTDLEADSTRTREAANIFRELLSKYPNYWKTPEAEIRLAECYQALQEPENILIVLSGFTTAGDPSLDLRARRLRANANYGAGRYIYAVSDFEALASQLLGAGDSEKGWGSPSLQSIVYSIAACIERIGGVESFESAGGSLTAKPYECAVYLELGRIYIEKERWKLATDCLSRSRDRCVNNKNHPELLSLLSIAHFESGYDQLSKEVRESLVRLYGEKSRRRLTADASGRKQIQDALEQAFVLPGVSRFRDAFEAATNNEEQRSRELYQRALDSFEDYLQAVPVSKTVQEILYYAAQASYELGEHEVSIAYYRRARNGAMRWPHQIAVPGLPAVDVGRESAYNVVLIEENHIEAKRRQLSGGSPDSTAVSEELTKLYNKLIADVDTLLQMFPDHSNSFEARRYQALASYRLGDYSTAVRMLSSVLSEASETNVAQHIQLLLADSYYRIDDYVKSEEVALMITTGMYRDRAYRIAANAALMNARKHQETEVYFRVAGKYPNTSQAAEALDTAVRLLWSSSASDSALRVAELLVQDSAYYVSLMRYLADDAQQARDWESARDLYGRLIVAYPGSPQAIDAHYSLGISLDSLGECRKAADEYNLAADLVVDTSRSLYARFCACRNLARCDSLSDSFIHSLRQLTEEALPFIRTYVETREFKSSDTAFHEMVAVVNSLLQASLWTGRWFEAHGSADSARVRYIWSDSIMQWVSSHIDMPVETWVLSNNYHLGRLTRNSLTQVHPKSFEDTREWLKRLTEARERALEYLRNVRDAGQLEYTPAAYVEISTTYGLFGSVVFEAARQLPFPDSLETWIDVTYEALGSLSLGIYSALECLSLTTPFDTTGPAFTESRQLASTWADSTIALCDFLMKSSDMRLRDTADVAQLRLAKEVHQRRLDIATAFYEFFSELAEKCARRDLVLVAESVRAAKCRSALRCGQSNIAIVEILDCIAERILTDDVRLKNTESLKRRRNEYLLEAIRWLERCLPADSPQVADSAKLILASLRENMK
jgi:tetratricopeptide (TPR) repeat protein